MWPQMHGTPPWADWMWRLFEGTGGPPCYILPPWTRREQRTHPTSVISLAFAALRRCLWRQGPQASTSASGLRATGNLKASQRRAATGVSGGDYAAHGLLGARLLGGRRVWLRRFAIGTGQCRLGFDLGVARRSRNGYGAVGLLTPTWGAGRFLRHHAGRPFAAQRSTRTDPASTPRSRFTSGFNGSRRGRPLRNLRRPLRSTHGSGNPQRHMGVGRPVLSPPDRRRDAALGEQPGHLGYNHQR